MLFYSETQNKKISLDEVAVSVYNYICEDESATYHIFAGADSQRDKGRTCYVTVISITRDGNGGINFVNKNVLKERITMKQRIWKEATDALFTFQQLIEKLDEKGINGLNAPIEHDQIHIDIGENGKSRELINEITGMIEAYGFKAVIKPDAFVAQCIANKFSKKF